MRIESLRKDGTCDPESIFSPGYEGYCRYYGMGTVKRGCPKTCKYALRQIESERASEEKSRSAGE